MALPRPPDLNDWRRALGQASVTPIGATRYNFQLDSQCTAAGSESHHRATSGNDSSFACPVLRNVLYRALLMTGHVKLLSFDPAHYAQTFGAQRADSQAHQRSPVSIFCSV